MKLSTYSNIISKYFPFLMMRGGLSGIRTQSLYGYNQLSLINVCICCQS
jgi:hypothetical protein